MRLKVVNFQSIAGSEIEVEGFTVVTGRSNLGKSALLRAVRAAFFGLPGDYYVREGTTHAGVAITSPDIKLIWRKVPKPTIQRQTALQVGENTHTKLGKEHGSLTETLGVKELTTSTKLTITPQFAMQHDAPFLLTESETNVAEIFRLLGRTDIVTSAQAAAKKDRMGAESLLKVRQPDLDEAKRKVDELQHVPALRKKVDQLRIDVNAAEMKHAQNMTTVTKIRDYVAIQPRTIPVAPVLKPFDKLETIAKLKKLATLQPIAIPADVTIDPPRPVFTAAIPGLKTLTAVTAELSTIKAAIGDNDGQQARLEQRRVELEEQLGLCPTCNRTFDKHDH